MKYYVIRKRIIRVGEEEADQIISIVHKEKIAKDFCNRFPNSTYEEIKMEKLKDEQRIKSVAILKRK